MSGVDTTITLGVDERPEAAQSRPWRWYCTVLFHPDAERIGAVARLDIACEELILGRREPVFFKLDGDECTLSERTVSRQALVLYRGDPHWEFCRRTGSSRLRLDGEELGSRSEVSTDRGRRGVVLTLGDRVVLHLRLRQDSVEDPDTSEIEATSTLTGRLPGVSELARSLRQEVARAAAAQGDVLLLGPTGTGKEHVARAIHDLGGDKPWVAVNVAALPPEIAAASLFGARKGAYTGADADRRGYFREADGGTLFLDEIGDAPESLQPQLLRALQEREIQVLGGRTERVSLRVIAATERNPEDPGALRPALRYRLGASEIHLPELHQRLEDLGVFAVAMLADGASATMPWEQSSDETLVQWARCFERLAVYAWPGNLRELQHVLTQLMARPTHPRIPARIGGHVGQGIEEPAPPSRPTPPVVRLADMDDALFLKAWKNAGFEPATLARALGVSRTSVYRRVERTPDCRLAADVPLAELLVALDECQGNLDATAQKLEVSRRGLATRLRAGGVSLDSTSDDEAPD